jgi:hypothetical protein
VVVVGVVAAVVFVVLELEAPPPQPAIASPIASAITLIGTVFLIRRIPPQDGVDGPGYKRLVL